VSGFINNRLPPEAMRKIGFAHSPELVERTLLEVSGGLGHIEVKKCLILPIPSLSEPRIV
jgi:hypothetical protein